MRIVTFKYTNGKRKFKLFTGYLWPKKNEKTKSISSGSDFPCSDGRQVACDAIQRPKNGLLLNTKGKDVTSFDDYLHLSLMG